MTFSEPGPINNADFLCSHGQILPSQTHTDKQYSLPYMYLNETVWNFLERRLGGGPSCRELKECIICRQVLEKILERKRYERKMFIKYKSKSAYSNYLASNSGEK